jgi:hypothetical protein
MSHDKVGELSKLCLRQFTINRRQMEGLTDINRYLGATQQPGGTLNSFCASNGYRQDRSATVQGY